MADVPNVRDMVARVERRIVGGEVVEVWLFLIRDSDQMEAKDGDEFITFIPNVPLDFLWEPRG